MMRKILALFCLIFAFNCSHAEPLRDKVKDKLKEGKTVGMVSSSENGADDAVTKCLSDCKQCTEGTVNGMDTTDKQEFYNNCCGLETLNELMWPQGQYNSAVNFTSMCCSIGDVKSCNGQFNCCEDSGVCNEPYNVQGCGVDPDWAVADFMSSGTSTQYAGTDSDKAEKNASCSAACPGYLNGYKFYCTCQGTIVIPAQKFVLSDKNGCKVWPDPDTKCLADHNSGAIKGNGCEVYPNDTCS